MKTKVTVIGSFCLFLFALDCSAQTLADAARRERERQKSVHSNVVIVNGATTTTAASTSTTTASTAAAPGAPATKALDTAKPAGPVDNKGHDEKYWRTQFEKARDAVKKAENNVQLLDLKIKDLNTQLLRQSDMYNREYRLGPEIAGTQKQLDDAHKQVDDAKKKVADLEDELRRSGGPAGWAR
jgi:predicted RNase H-like nuclease (RuvC/YqgF family)